MSDTLLNPFTGERHPIAKADNDGPSGGRVLTTALVPGWHGAFAGKKGHKLRATGRELGETVGGSLVGGAAGALTHNRNAAIIGSRAAGTAGSVHSAYANQRLGRYQPDPGKRPKETKAASMMTVPVTNVRSVKVMVPTGKHVSHANDLAVIRHRPRHHGPTQALESYRGQGPAKSAVSPQHQGSTPVRKASGLGQARAGFRGTPGSDIAQQSRHGRRIVNKAGGEDYKNYFPKQAAQSGSVPAQRANNADRTMSELPRNAGRSGYNASTKAGGSRAFFAGRVGASTPRAAAKKPGLFARMGAGRKGLKIAGRFN